MSDVLVAGAGPTGLTLACDLLASGVSVRVVDAAPGPARTSRALGLQPRGGEVLDRAGALADVDQWSIPLRKVAIDLGGRSAAVLQVGRRTALVTRPARLVSQAEVEAGLRRRLAQLGQTEEWNLGVVRAGQGEDQVTVGLSDGSTARCAWLVGCDGAHSRVRKLAGIGFPGVQIIERFLLADVHADLPAPRDSASVWLHGDQILAAFPLPGLDLWRLMAPAPPGTPEGLKSAAIVDLLSARLSERAGWPSSRIVATEWTSVFKIQRRLADRYREGRILLAGDAAHIHSPLGGQGMNTGLGDAENLAWKLALVASHRAEPSLLDSYELERRPIAADVLSSTSALTRMVVGESTLARVLRDRLFVPLLHRPAVQRRIWEHASQLKVTYRCGPLAGNTWTRFRTRPQAGDRVPDWSCRHGDGTVTRLHAELGSRWVLLTPSSPPMGATQALMQCSELVRRRLGADLVTVLTTDRLDRNSAMLVRPDGHLGWRGAPSASSVDRWLTRVLGVDPTSQPAAETPINAGPLS
ncbi:MAG: Salicylate hydroxylase [uncultured Propionibacteriaceae bacterium]|uniref:Salicylate hydroxylase n=1 Tax=uncultured Propionibacteriaceae bacterium TaxID=257457 RepID=A0A6N3IXE2_9ACTN|nr:MAG: Salicylate hydroxylase [uncultured Propionibacteriaceae bacterium]